MNESDNSSGLLTFGEHIEIMRNMLSRIIAVVIIFAIIIFCFRQETFEILLAPRNSDFYTFQLIENRMKSLGWNFHFDEYDIPLISTELSSQFMTHITVSCVLAGLLASPYIILELFRFLSPALYDNEKKCSYLVAIIIYALFILGILMSYFVLFPISYRFLATYQVNECVVNTITLDSYISTFITLTFTMGVVFQFPVFTFFLSKMGLIDSELLKQYRAYALVVIMIVAAVITPPDIFTLILVSIPIYGLYELSIWLIKKQERPPTHTNDA